jgi:protein-S-isoprenylcysteine O-methyltransferase Ste14
VNVGSPRLGRRFARDVLLGHAVPASVFLALLLARAVDLAPGLSAGPTNGASLAFCAFALQQSLGLLFGGVCVILFLRRRAPIGQGSAPLGALVALAGTFAPYLPISAPVAADNPTLLFVSSGLILAGLGWSIVSLVCLGRCFGLFPEARGLVTRGPYRWLRHPLYLGELTAVLGLVVATASAAMLGLFLLLCGLQLWRSRLEEQVLARTFPEYVEYQRLTYHIVPWFY